MCSIAKRHHRTRFPLTRGVADAYGLTHLLCGVCEQQERGTFLLPLIYRSTWNFGFHRRDRLYPLHRRTIAREQSEPNCQSLRPSGLHRSMVVRWSRRTLGLLRKQREPHRNYHFQPGSCCWSAAFLLGFSGCCKRRGQAPGSGNRPGW